jgi:hypothetical protein
MDNRPDQALRLKRLLAEKAPWVTEPFAAGGNDAELEAAQRALALLGYGGDGSEKEGPQWAWTCPEHEDQRSSEPRPCARCGAPPLLVRTD